MTTIRLSAEANGLLMALVAASRGTCRRRRVGCVLVNKDKHVLATGYNGSASGTTHCIDIACGGANQPSGQGLSLCEAIHAEQNALLQCPDVRTIDTVYCTTAPCVDCTKLLMNTSARRIIFLDDYPHSRQSEKLWSFWAEGETRPRYWLHYKTVLTGEEVVTINTIRKALDTYGKN